MDPNSQSYNLSAAKARLVRKKILQHKRRIKKGKNQNSPPTLSSIVRTPTFLNAIPTNTPLNHKYVNLHNHKDLGSFPQSYTSQTPLSARQQHVSSHNLENISSSRQTNQTSRFTTKTNTPLADITSFVENTQKNNASSSTSTSRNTVSNRAKLKEAFPTKNRQRAQNLQVNLANKFDAADTNVVKPREVELTEAAAPIAENADTIDTRKRNHSNVIHPEEQLNNASSSESSEDDQFESDSDSETDVDDDAGLLSNTNYTSLQGFQLICV
ncbi:hypothetical protein TSUD_107370 [Trifolium subterraneum]|uniref:Uncharacterized protein n=1 Tax=Trifolium subterraneum TaxID=3900 RepID=A0A2Z6PAB7_TRISU|nr:hypothetical protein TSUD_107370 [Trifolium subterraneum]